MTAVPGDNRHFIKYGRRDFFVCQMCKVPTTALGPKLLHSCPILIYKIRKCIEHLGLVLCNAISGVPPTYMLHNTKATLPFKIVHFCNAIPKEWNDDRGPDWGVMKGSLSSWTCSSFVRWIQSRPCSVGGMINGTLLDLLKTTAPIDSSGLKLEIKLDESSKFTALM